MDFVYDTPRNYELQDTLVSVVIPVYNSINYIEKAYHSVRNQTYPCWEVIFVDDGSTDGSKEFLKKLVAQSEKDSDVKGKIKLLCSKVNHGPAAARNSGIREAKGRYLAYLDADDIWLPDKIEKQIRHIQNGEFAFSFTGYAYADENGVFTGKVVHIPDRITYQEALCNTTISTITVMFDRKKIPNSLLFMPEDAEREDTASWWNILKNGYTAYGLDEILSIYRRHKGSHSYNKWKAIRGTWQLYRRREGMTLQSAIKYFVGYVFRAVIRRL